MRAMTSQGPAVPSAPPRILVVEDEALIAAELVDRLRRRGYEVIGPEDSADAAVNAVEQLRPTIVLMDIRLKGERDGIDAANEIHRRFDVPVVFLTANADRATYERAHTTAQYGYVLKPFHERDLFLALDLALHRHRIEEDLQANSLTFAAISDGVADGVVVADSDGIVRYLNPSAERLLGWTLFDAAGHPLSRVLPHPREMNRATPNGSPDIRVVGSEDGTPGPVDGTRDWTSDWSDDDTVTMHRHGEVIPVSWRCRTLVSPRGEPAGHVHTVTDLRPLRRLEEQRRASDELLRVAFEASPVAIALLDGAGRLLRTNPGFHALTGWTPTSATTPAAHIVSPGDRDAFRHWLEAAPLAGTRPAPVEMQLRHVSGRSVQVLSTLVKISETFGSEAVVLWQCQRIDQQKELITTVMRHSAAAASASRGTLPFRHVLLVEDEPSLRQILQRMLARFGLETTAVPDGEAALRALRAPSGEIDVVVTDVIMPGMSGGELAMHIEQEFPRLPLIFITGFHDDSFVSDRVNAARHPLLYKPFSSDELQRALRDLALANPPAG